MPSKETNKQSEKETADSKTPSTPIPTTSKGGNVGNYSQPGIHPGDEVNAAGEKEQFDRGDPGEDKKDIMLEKGKTWAGNTEIPVEYSQAGLNTGAEIDAAGHKKKFDRGAPEENPEALSKAPAYVEETEVSKPNYVAKEFTRLKEAGKSKNAGLSEKEFIGNLISKATAGGWDSPIITDLKHRLETL